MNSGRPDKKMAIRTRTNLNPAAKPVSLTAMGILLLTACAGRAGALENYVQKPDPAFNWKQTSQKRMPGATVTHLEMVSQHWRGQFWSHHLQVVRPASVRNPHIALLFITGDGDGTSSAAMLQTVADRAGAMAAVLTKVPNQPLYGGRKEDALIAYTFDQYLKTNDETWPLLFPMVKSAVRAMDALQEFAAKEHNETIKQFVVSGASKRGWTTWLTAAVDPRVSGIAPMVIDMLNMKAQVEWAEKMYGHQSEQIRDYTDLNLIAKIDEPPMRRLRSWVDPFSYRERYTMPKLLLLGTNDPYWVVDSLRHYWNELPGPKLVFQTPNAGHDLGGGKEAIQTLAAWFQMIADGHPLPRVEWTFDADPSGKAKLKLSADQKAKGVRLWTAESSDRDFRNDKWSSRDLEVRPGSSKAEAVVENSGSGFRAFMGEVTLMSPTGHEYKVSTEARVVPGL